MTNIAEVVLENGDAVVTAGDCRFHVVTRDRAGDEAACPVHLLEGALGACITLTIDAVAKNKNIDISHLKVRLERVKTDDGTLFSVYLSGLGDGITERERKILYRSAQLCDVGKILKGNVRIDYHLGEVQ